jgi:hypothetical protein
MQLRRRRGTGDEYGSAPPGTCLRAPTTRLLLRAAELSFQTYLFFLQLLGSPLSFQVLLSFLEWALGKLEPRVRIFVSR